MSEARKFLAAVEQLAEAANATAEELHEAGFGYMAARLERALTKLTVPDRIMGRGEVPQVTLPDSPTARESSPGLYPPASEPSAIVSGSKSEAVGPLWSSPPIGFAVPAPRCAEAGCLLTGIRRVVTQYGYLGDLCQAHYEILSDSLHRPSEARA